YDQVRTALVDGKEPIPLLEDLIGAFPDARINIDTKADASVDAVAAVVQRTGSIDRVCVGSFSDARTERIRAILGPRLCTSLGPKGTAILRGASYGLAGSRRVEGASAQ